MCRNHTLCPEDSHLPSAKSGTWGASITYSSWWSSPCTPPWYLTTSDTLFQLAAIQFCTNMASCLPELSVALPFVCIKLSWRYCYKLGEEFAKLKALLYLGVSAFCLSVSLQEKPVLCVPWRHAHFCLFPVKHWCSQCHHQGTRETGVRAESWHWKCWVHEPTLKLSRSELSGPGI